MNFPLLYCNGCSYSDKNYKKPTMEQNVYVNRVHEVIGSGFVLNRAISGSNNKRILRTSLHDLYNQRQINPTQKIIALIQLTFEIRDEIWYKNINAIAEESDFITHQFFERLDWQERLLKFLDISVPHRKIKNAFEQKFLKKYSEGRAFFFSPYQERINLTTDLVMFTNTCEKLNVDYLIFQGPKAEQLQEEYLLDFFKSLLPKQNIFDLEKFGFCDWCDEHKFVPLDKNEIPCIGHYGPDAHRAFADNIIIPQLQKLKII